MIDENIRFEKEGDLYKLFYNSRSKEYDMGISFMTEYNIEDYPITILEQINGRDCYLAPCKNVVIKLLNPPEKTKRIEIARDAGIEFSGDFVLGIEKTLRFETNKGTAFSFKENPDREKFVRFKELEVSRNENSIFFFSKSNVKRKIDPLLLDSMTKGISKLSNNEDVFFSLREDIQGLDLRDNVFSSEETGGEIICDSLYVSLDAISAREDNSSEESASLTLSADAVHAINVNFHLAGALEIVNRGTKSIGGSKIAISNTQIEKPDYIEREGAGILEVDCDYLQIDTSTKLLISGENRIECLGGKVTIDNRGDNLHDPLRLDSTKIFIPEDGEAKATIRRVEGRDSSLTLAKSEDNKYFIKRAYLVNSEAKNISGDIYLYAENSKINGITFEENSGLVFETSSDHHENSTKFIAENILLKKDSFLEVTDIKGSSVNIALKNILVEEEAKLTSGVDFSMQNSIFAKGSTLIGNSGKKLEMSNSILQGTNAIKGVVSIANSKIEGSTIISKDAKIEDAQLIDVTDYEAYSKYKTKEVIVVTNKIEKL